MRKPGQNCHERRLCNQVFDYSLARASNKKLQFGHPQLLNQADNLALENQDVPQSRWGYSQFLGIDIVGCIDKLVLVRMGWAIAL
ncbi:hypothetical protein LC653_44515 [Nostoc sp. CHAB 5784]|uniref:hypothetical protein n=1 Tax=Nostoc mirabile TaxID=2907820 RepID=UPI001E300EC0|nr:hypothetical protein [Nostoc mirabile]MCC5670648.1 hypothetical protein [Nostoc mirabile CHAB5784]